MRIAENRASMLTQGSNEQSEALRSERNILPTESNRMCEVGDKGPEDCDEKTSSQLQLGALLSDRGGFPLCISFLMF